MRTRKSTGWIDEQNLLPITRWGLRGDRLLDIYFQKTKPKVFKNGYKSKMVKITVIYPDLKV